MNQAAAIYKLKDGFSVYIRKKISECMTKHTFIFNIDECTSNNSQNVFSIAVSYFDMEIGDSVVHEESVSLIEVNSQSLLKCICNSFSRDSMRFDELVSDLSGTIKYMNDKKKDLKNCLEIKLSIC